MRAVRLWRRHGDVDRLRAAYRDADRAGRLDECERLARLVVERDPQDAGMWFDLALAAKRRRDWPEAARLNERALAVSSGPGDPAAWNLGIAATALGDAATARRAWAVFGVPGADEGDGLELPGLGAVPVRLNPDGGDLRAAPLELDGVVHATEVVWAQRLSPAHARLLSVPSPECGHRFGDVVLTDGVPRGERHDGHRWVAVLDELARLERSSMPTWTARVDAPAPADVDDLVRRAERVGLAAEDWTATLELLCAACSEGRPGAHDHGPTGTSWSPRRSVGMAGAQDAVRGVVVAWAAAAPDAGAARSSPRAEAPSPVRPGPGRRTWRATG